MDTDVAGLCAKLRGKFIVLDGPDGSGKSTQQQLTADALTAAGAEVVSCRDPGGTEIGDRIRSVLLDYDLSTMNVSCETLLFMASRAQLVAEVIRPALQAKKTVLCDRFVTSTCAYQGAAGDDPARVIELARFAIGDCWPDLTILIDIDAEEGFKRIGRRAPHAGKNRTGSTGDATSAGGSGLDAMETRSVEFHRRVGQIFREAGDYYPTPVVSVDGGAEPDAVHQHIMECLFRVTL